MMIVSVGEPTFVARGPLPMPEVRRLAEKYGREDG